MTARSRTISYGDEITSTSNDREKFATYTRDSYTGLDYADQRYYASTYGRFNTADPYQASGGPSSPASWNRYVYTLGDPINGSDPTGLCDDGDAMANGDYDYSIGDGACPVLSIADDGSDDGDSTGDGTAPVVFTVNSCTAGQVWDDGSQSCVNQSFNQCMADNMNTASLPGVLNQVLNAVSGSNSSGLQNNQFLQFAYGNFVTALFWGSASDAAGAGAGLAPVFTKWGMGAPTTFARRTGTIMAINISGKGGLRQALNWAAKGAATAIENLGSVLGGGIPLQVSLPMNLILTAAEAGYCAGQ